MAATLRVTVSVANSVDAPVTVMVAVCGPGAVGEVAVMIETVIVELVEELLGLGAVRPTQGHGVTAGDPQVEVTV
jgi:hypothetical protein